MLSTGPSFVRSALPSALALALTACSTVLGTFTNEGAGGSGAGGGEAATTSTATGTPGCEGCSPNAKCVENLCVCSDGFEGDGKTCDDVDECAKKPEFCGANAVCQNKVGGVDCVCDPGFVGTSKGCLPAFEDVASFPTLSFDGFGGRAFGTPTKIYFVNESQANPFMFSFQVDTKQTKKEPSVLAGSDLFCACGFTTTVTSVGEQLFAFGNSAAKFGGTWKPISTYVPPFRRGEATSFTLDGNVYILGGRDESNFDQATTILYNPLSDAFDGPNVLPLYVWGPVSQAAAVVVDQDVYVLGGRVTVGNQAESNRMAVFRSGQKTWEKLPDLPFAGNRVTAATRNGAIFYTDGKKIARYDVKAATWDAKTIALPAGEFWMLAGTGKDVFVVGEKSDGIHVLHLNELPN